MSWTLAAPLLIPFATAALALVGTRFGLAPRSVSLAGSGLHLAAAVHLAATVLEDGVLGAAMGGWAAPVGIVLVADTLSVVMLTTAAFMGLVIAAFAGADIDPRRERAGWHALYQLLLAGASGAFLTGDLFNLYVWFEVMLIASFGLVVVGGSRAELDAGIKYAAINILATLFLLISVGLIHGLSGTLTMADLPRKLADADPVAVEAASLLLFASIAAKAGLFPLWFWLPAAHHTPPAAVKAIFAVTLTKSGMYALIRLYTLVFPEGPAQEILVPVGIATMVLGVVLAAAQKDIHRILSAHILSQIGYVALALGLGSALALAAGILYMLHNIVVKACLLMVAGVGYRLTGSYALGRSGGLYAASPGLSALFLLAALAMAGLPPFSGFWGKLLLIEAGFEAGAPWVALAVLGVGVFTLYSMTKIWGQGYLKPHPSRRVRSLAALPAPARSALVAPLALLVAVSLGIGLHPDPLIALSSRAADEVLDPASYIAAVMGEPAVPAEGRPAVPAEDEPTARSEENPTLRAEVGPVLRTEAEPVLRTEAEPAVPAEETP